ncbi:TetR/AcrR family transcriptional regulator [Paractinoplanes globisporus]|uniref:TetR family transcriptional regulator n=1 Tax=Paractinoplanes globisporus TaxID=113565 RepID=A0ABW6WFB1_9ACTN|nr:TetR/AcrR family transcriptional regulator [Actinoplanes globisporus]
MTSEPRDALLAKVIEAVAKDGLADRSLREIAASAGTSHRMLLYHFGSREGLLAAIVTAIEAQQRAAMTETTDGTAAEVMTAVWERVSSPELRPFVRLFFEVFALATRGATGTGELLESLTTPWLDDATEVATRMGVTPDRAAMRLGVAVSRGLLLDLLAGAPQDEVDEAYRLFVRLSEAYT